jgi:poly-gamma-glutamate capsule biosynthesis protein CapA/YwtB (metallophosphatase superfamily)/PKD repeat protein
MKIILILFMSLISLRAEIIHESGNLVEFFGGIAPESAYDNWVSHVTEGIASVGYNDYGPPWLDVQSNGFGTHTLLEEGSPTLDYWKTIFFHLINNDTTLVDSLLTDSLESFYYELVLFQDTIVNRTFHILREKLDSSFIDLNLPNISEDDVRGSFRNGWGLYIINLEATRNQVLVQVPHPCDDFIAPYIAMDLFLEIDAKGFMINGTGREVLWNEDGSYTNGKSLSDPTRYRHTVFQLFQEIISEPLFDIYPHEPLVFAIHSFDNESHATRNSIIIAAGALNGNTNKPIRDISGDYLDIINFTQEFPIHANQFFNSNPVHVSQYYEANYSGVFNYNTGSQLIPIRESTSLNGIQFGHQMFHLQNLVDGNSVYEPWVQVEMDEKPMMFDSSGISDEILYIEGLYPTSVHNFSIIRDYYTPFIEAIQLYLNHWEIVPDLLAPDSIEYFRVFNMDIVNQVYLTWNPVFDTNFKSYEIQVDTDSIAENSPIYDYLNYSLLQDMMTNNILISGLNNTETLIFRIRALDYFGNVGLWSNTVSNFLPGHSPADTILTFDDSIVIESISDQDIDGESFGIDTVNTMPGSSPSLSLFGNTWKSVQITPILPDTHTVFQLFARIDSISGIQAIGFSDGTNTIRYSLAGNEIANIEEWIPVYQGSGQSGHWVSFELPVGDDWVAWYDTLSPLTEIHFINDNDNNNLQPGAIHFSLIRNITSTLPISPDVSIDFSMGNNRIINLQEMVSVSFTSVIEDIDSYDFSYYWEFGDGTVSTQPNPTHEYIVEDDHDYTVILSVEDETGHQGWGTVDIQIDEGEGTFPLTINFVGDIMMGRRFEEDGGIIPTQGAFALFEPTYEILGLAADISVANLEIVLSNQGTPHPTKGIVFRCAPENVSGLFYGGIDVVSLANNHILDYMEPALIQTQNILTAAGIIHSGAGMNRYEAYLPAFKSVKGQIIAFLSSSDRTGQYNNYQPYLQAGENKSGFAYMTPYYLKQQIHSVKDITDLIVVEMHAGSEYSSSPSDNYDSYEPPDGYESMRNNPASEIGFIRDPLMGMEAEDYSPRLDRPQIWDRAIRRFAIDEGADAVIVHHPHIIQGVEIYNGKMIAHSLGNFIFDLNYPETYPSMILNAEADESGFTGYSITPLYIDDYLTVPATGELGNYILDYLAMRSRELDTYVHVNQETNRASVVMDTFSMQNQSLDYFKESYSWRQTELNGQTYFVSKPLSIPKTGSLSDILNVTPNISHYRLGREKIWMKNFEYEGSSLWNVNSDNEFLQDSIYRRGGTGLSHIRTSDSPDNIITNLEDRMPFRNEYDYSIHGYIKTENGENVTLQLRLSDGRSGGNILTASMKDSVQGTLDWQYYWGNVPGHEEANFFDIRMSSGVPEVGIAYSWFDDIGLIQWDSTLSINDFSSIQNPNDYNYIQIFSNDSSVPASGIQLRNTIIGDLPALDAVPRVVNPVVTLPNKFHFYDESRGPVAHWRWDFINQIHLDEQHPSFDFPYPGVFQVSLTVTGLNGETDTENITVIALASDSEPHDLGDINGDGVLTPVDVLLCANYILGILELAPEEFLAADIDENGIIEIYDILLITDFLN